MQDDLKPYPAYKDSGVPWLGKVPDYWELKSLRASAIVEKGRLPRSLVERGRQPEGSVPYLSMNYLRSIGELPFEYAAYQPDLVLVHRGETILLWDGANAGEFLKAKPGAVSSTAARVMPRMVDQQFFFYACQQVEHTLRALAVGMGIPHVDGNVLKGLSVTIPPKAEQLAIVRYLDHADRKVRHAIRARQRLITLLTEQKQAIIQRAVTRGLDADVRLKPSGVPWLGDVPEHWEVATLRRYLRPVDGIKIGPFGSQLKLDQMSRSGYKVYGQANVIANDFAVGSKFVDSEKYDELSTCEVRPGDLLVTMMGTSGRCASVPQGAAAGIMDSHLLRLRMGARVDVNFAAFIVNDSSYVKEQIAAIGKGSIMLGLNSSMVKDIVLALPPLSEQAIVLRYLDGATADLDRAIAAAYREIDLLREYRTRLIADVVTGKLDVRDAATHLPDELEEQSEPLDEEPADDAADLESEEEGNGEQTES